MMSIHAVSLNLYEENLSNSVSLTFAYVGAASWWKKAPHIESVGTRARIGVAHFGLSC